MSFLDLVRQRYSVRAYKPDPVEEEELRQVLEAARLAPTAKNLQPFQLVIIHTKGRKAELQRVNDQEWFTQPPILICACGIPAEGYVRADGRRYLDVDLAIVMDHLILAATELGLGTCWCAAFDAQAAREVLELPQDVEPILFTGLGYAADQPKEKERKSLEQLVRYERW
jgi:nitroreductase